MKRTAAVLLIVAAVGCTGETKPPVVPDPPANVEPLPTMADYMTPQEKRQERARKRVERIREHFNRDGSHKGLTELILRAMDNPRSYEHVLTRYWDQGDHLRIYVEFRGTNKFGAIVKGTIVAIVDLRGNVVEILAQE